MIRSIELYLKLLKEKCQKRDYESCKKYVSMLRGCRFIKDNN